MSIVLNLTDEAIENYARYNGWDDQKRIVDQKGNLKDVPNDVTAEDFVYDRFFNHIMETLVAKRDADALAAAQAQPLPDITTDGSYDATADA